MPAAPRYVLHACARSAVLPRPISACLIADVAVLQPAKSPQESHRPTRCRDFIQAGSGLLIQNKQGMPTRRTNGSLDEPTAGKPVETVRSCLLVFISRFSHRSRVVRRIWVARRALSAWPLRFYSSHCGEIVYSPGMRPALSVSCERVASGVLGSRRSIGR